MGYASKEAKERICPHCKGILYTTAKGLQTHSLQCERLKKIGLVSPNLIIRHLED